MILSLEDRCGRKVTYQKRNNYYQGHVPTFESNETMENRRFVTLVTNSTGFINRIRNQTPIAAMRPSLVGICGRYVRAKIFNGSAMAPWCARGHSALLHAELICLLKVPPWEK